MSSQILELLIFAAIAFFIINKLVSVLGKTWGDLPSLDSFFPNNRDTDLKDVTSTTGATCHNFNVGLKNLILEENREEIQRGLQKVLEKLPTFNPQYFVDRVKIVFKTIIKSALQNDDKQLKDLIDKRYIESFKQTAVPAYTKLYRSSTINHDISACISEIYLFGNDIFIKICLNDNNTKEENLREEWTFFKSTLNNSPNWYLTNIDSLR